jgi:hypothetical protein
MTLILTVDRDAPNEVALVVNYRMRRALMRMFLPEQRYVDLTHPNRPIRLCLDDAHPQAEGP